MFTAEAMFGGHGCNTVYAESLPPALCCCLQIEAGASVIEIVLDDEADIPTADTMIAVMYGFPDALHDTEQQIILRMALLASKYDAQKVLTTAV
jgi:hypothetical protein